VPWLLLAILLTARLENAVLHTIESIVLMQYTPGFITAVIVVLPISFYLLRRLIRLDLVRLSWLPGIIAAGFIVQAVGIGAMLLLGSI
jgi:nitrate reductase gamma subunit